MKAVVMSVLLVACPAFAAAQAAAPRTSWGVPDLQGIWDYSTLAGLERPPYVDKAVLETPEDVAAARQGFEDWVASLAGNDAGDWLELRYEFPDGGRTALIVDPATGTLPDRTAAGQARMDTLGEGVFTRDSDDPEDRSLMERCIVMRTRPIQPGFYNQQFQLFQTRDHVVIFHEMIHDPLVIPLDGRPHLPTSIRQWHGDSRGHWEGDTLVVQTSNYTDKTTLQGSGANLRLVERFTRIDADSLRYEYTVNDPDSFDREWSVDLPMKRTDLPIYEYACHEGNRSMPLLLRGGRLQAP